MTTYKTMMSNLTKTVTHFCNLKKYWTQL